MDNGIHGIGSKYNFLEKSNWLCVTWQNSLNFRPNWDFPAMHRFRRVIFQLPSYSLISISFLSFVKVISNFFSPKSNPYMALVNFRKKIRLVSFDFRRNLEVRTFTRWLSIRGTKFFWEISKIFFLQNLHYGPIEWVPKRFIQILIF
jgi:hypothetical protein